MGERLGHLARVGAGRGGTACGGLRTVLGRGFLQWLPQLGRYLPLTVANLVHPKLWRQAPAPVVASCCP